jgi:hypothetical protein
MMGLTYHKGSFCIHNSVFCQEGYCSECAIYFKKLSTMVQIQKLPPLQSLKTPELLFTH